MSDPLWPERLLNDEDDVIRDSDPELDVSLHSPCTTGSSESSEKCDSDEQEVSDDSDKEELPQLQRMCSDSLPEKRVLLASSSQCLKEQVSDDAPSRPFILDPSKLNADALECSTLDIDCSILETVDEDKAGYLTSDEEFSTNMQFPGEPEKDYLNSDDEDESDSTCTDDGHETFDFFSEPLYEDAPISVNECLIAVLVFAFRYCLSDKCLEDLLKLLLFVCRPLNCKMISTSYRFWKHFSRLKALVKYHYFCSDCYHKLSTDKSECPFSGTHEGKTKVSYFLELPLVSQVKSLFERKSFVDSLSHRFKRVKISGDAIEDIYDGQLYKEQVQSGFLSSKNPFNYSLIFNSDGVPVYSSSNTSLWPVYFVITELPLHLRYARENMMLGGIWYGAHKPEPNLMMDAFRSSLVELYKGVSVIVEGFTQSIIARGKLLFGTCDLPAKCMLMCMRQFNGSYGCQICKQKGESVEILPSKPDPKRKRNDDGGKTQRKKSVWVYKYTNNMDLRNHSETVNYGKQAQQQREVTSCKSVDINIFGVLYPSALSKLMPDFIRGMGVDIMHCVFLGTVKKLATLWFSSDFSKEPFSLYKYLDAIDRKFMDITPPNFVQRGVRSIKEHMKHWKASEWKNFFFYYSVLLLIGVLPDIYFDNYYDLVVSLYVLNSKSISPAQVLSCDKRLNRFVKSFQNLYGVRHMMMNIHLLLHLPLMVTNLGHLWAYNCAPFENMNGLLLKVITGTRHVQTQLASCAYIVIKLPEELSTISASDIKNYCYRLLHPSLKLKRLEDIGQNSFTVGTYKVVNLSDELKELFKAAGIVVHRSQTFCKLKKGRFLFVAECYKRQVKTMSTYITYIRDGIEHFGSIASFHRISNCECKILCLCKPALFYAVVVDKTVETVKGGSTLSAHDVSFVFKICDGNNEPQSVINVENVESLLYFVKIGRDKYLCKPVNMLEAEL